MLFRSRPFVVVCIVVVATVVAALVAAAPGEAIEEPAERILFIRGADGSGGFLEASNIGERTEQLADINNQATGGGNHGWAQFAELLRGDGFDVTQITEVAESDGVTEGRPADLTDLASYDIVVFGSNNAVYQAEHIDAVDAYVRGGGAVLFISDANFGGSWQDAANSDQQFLDRYGIGVYQDTGTYRVDANEFSAPDHPVLDGISAFDGEGVSPFDLSTVSDDLDLTMLARAEGSVRANPGDGQGSTQAATATDAAAWVAEVGAGRIAGHYDRNTFFNTNGAGTNITRFANATYASNLFAWLGDAPGAPQAPLGDVNCDGEQNILDALVIAQYTVGTRTEAASCPLANPTTELVLADGDMDNDTAVTILDALRIAQCSVGTGTRCTY